MIDAPLPPESSRPEPDRPAALAPEVAALLKRTPDGLVPAVVQDATTGQVLMMAWMDDTALAQTLSTRRGTYFSRSRNRLWIKGEESGHTQHVREVRLDCDGDTILLTVDQTGPACHTGLQSCFDSHTLLNAESLNAESLKAESDDTGSPAEQSEVNR